MARKPLINWPWLVRHMTTLFWVNVDLGNGFLSADNKPEPSLNNHQRGLVPLDFNFTGNSQCIFDVNLNISNLGLKPNPPDLSASVSISLVP